MKMLSTLAIFVSAAVAKVPTSQYTFSQSIVHNGHPSPLLDFKVTATNEKNETWICNRLQFALSMRFDELVMNGTSVDIHLSNKTVVNGIGFISLYFTFFDCLVNLCHICGVVHHWCTLDFAWYTRCIRVAYAWCTYGICVSSSKIFVHGNSSAMRT